MINKTSRESKVVSYVFFFRSNKNGNNCLVVKKDVATKNSPWFLHSNTARALYPRLVMVILAIKFSMVVCKIRLFKENVLYLVHRHSTERSKVGPSFIKKKCFKS